jgi:hypothetical protein
MWVDGVVTDTREARTASIANNRPLSIAGKSDCNQISVGCDYFVGAIDYVRIEKHPANADDGRQVLAETDFADGLADLSGVMGLSIDKAANSPADGGPSLRAQVEGEVATGHLPLAETSYDVCAEVDFRATRVGSESTYSLIKLRNDEGDSVARMRVDARGTLSGRADVVKQSFPTSALLEPGRWHRLGLCVGVGASASISLSVDGEPVSSWTGTTGSSPIAAVQLGDNSANTATVHWDALQVTSAA